MIDRRSRSWHWQTSPRYKPRSQTASTWPSCKTRLIALVRFRSNFGTKMRNRRTPGAPSRASTSCKRTWQVSISLNSWSDFDFFCVDNSWERGRFDLRVYRGWLPRHGHSNHNIADLLPSARRETDTGRGNIVARERHRRRMGQKSKTQHHWVWRPEAPKHEAPIKHLHRPQQCRHLTKWLIVFASVV